MHLQICLANLQNSCYFARLLSERRSLDDGPLYETAILNELMKWSSWQSNPPSLNFFRTRSGREVDFVIHSSQGFIAIEARASAKAHRQDARPIIELMERLRPSAKEKNGLELGLVVTRGREVEPLAPHVWAVPFWLLFGPTEGIPSSGYGMGQSTRAKSPAFPL
jgi:predicted AAA+ superfamily ATPase